MWSFQFLDNWLKKTHTKPNYICKRGQEMVSISLSEVSGMSSPGKWPPKVGYDDLQCRRESSIDSPSFWWVWSEWRWWWDDGEMMVISSILLSMWHLIARTDDTDIKYQVDFPLKSSQPLFEAKFHNYLQLLF